MIVVPINALFASDNINPKPDFQVDGFSARELIEGADLIISRDVMSGREGVAYGVHDLKRIVEGGLPEDLFSIAVEIDDETDDLPRLAALVQVVRGEHHYDAGAC